MSSGPVLSRRPGQLVTWVMGSESGKSPKGPVLSRSGAVITDVVTESLMGPVLSRTGCTRHARPSTRVWMC